MSLLPQWVQVALPVIGMVHLRALPGSPRYDGDLDSVTRAAIEDATALCEGGVDGLIIENFGDAPFYPRNVPPHVISHMTAITVRLCDALPAAHSTTPIGINVLRNDGCAAMSIAHAVGAEFVRINVLCGARVADQGVIEGIAHEVLRLRETLGAQNVRVIADVDVKHSSALSIMPIEYEAHDAVRRGLADGVIVSGCGTGRPVDAAHVRRVKDAVGDTPVFIGSGVTADTIGTLRGVADGVIVGTALKCDGVTSSAVDVLRVRELVATARG